MQSSSQPPAPAHTVVRHWRLALGLGVVVTGVVALLLTMLARVTEQIEEGVAEIWRVGQLLANNTVHIPLLARTNQSVDAMLPKADRVAAATGRIQRAVGGDKSAEGAAP